ncbi:MAG: glutamate racemase [Candidatus Kerfeldbacteria bacterium RIFOXYA2_FULL_38_24]|uniref:Glutamate racemase n=1 Tax=Candidatus Kerfeldbacteria bacterium RIFOXYB2_FULL_38_14 TaxID=1798547 RepID=A0A1G2BGL4_9BACT|nr:MAG: glutamate racemase [Candidatus Kerfeldbacteria bacterium RIFOXYB2_FULL_38_14]OGY87868.1 MAG: glutamate racemase [Candidatus Kerfeldbacteria bacterium RIFOXYA2_FULL_38_24]OGY90015.1 MAG: glutamate racemase [Candidatus Kerfeldbacteria bacterium RIFOXYC2_FULL_38_9]
MISILDSGVGGLSILKELKQKLPEASLLYFGDTAYMPYGALSGIEIYERVKLFLETFEKETDMFVIACNSATVSMIDDYRELTNKPIIGVEPGIKPAAAISQSKHVAVLATVRAAKNPQIPWLIKEYGGDCRFHILPCKNLALAIERKPEYIEDALEEALVDLQPEVDTVVLGCTHYNLIKDVIQKKIGDRIIVDTSEPVARRAVIVYNAIPHKKNQKPGITFKCSGDNQAFLKRIKELTPELLA